MQRDYYEPLNPRQGTSENQAPTSGASPRSAGEPNDMMPGDETQGGGMTDKAGDYVDTAKEKAGQARAAVMEQTEQGRQKAATGLDSAADQLRERLSGEGMQGQVGTKVADSLEKTADYLREHETSEIWDDIEQYVQDHPMQAAVGALAAGFLIGRVIR